MKTLSSYNAGEGSQSSEVISLTRLHDKGASSCISCRTFDVHQLKAAAARPVTQNDVPKISKKPIRELSHRKRLLYIDGRLRQVSFHLLNGIKVLLVVQKCSNGRGAN